MLELGQVPEGSSEDNMCKVTRIDTDDSRRKRKLLELMGEPELLDDGQVKRLREHITKHLASILASGGNQTWCRLRWIPGMHLQGSSQCAVCLLLCSRRSQGN